MTDDRPGVSPLRVRPRRGTSGGYHEVQIACRDEGGLLVYGRFASTAALYDDRLYVDEVAPTGDIVASTTVSGELARVELDLRGAWLDRQELRIDVFRVLREAGRINIDGPSGSAVIFAESPVAAIAEFQGFLAVSRTGERGTAVTVHRLDNGAALVRLRY